MYDPYDSLIPIFRETSTPTRIKPLATAVYVTNKMGDFLYTAAHVTDDLELAKLLIPVQGKLSRIEGYVAFIDLLPDQDRENDNVDIAYIKLPSSFTTELRHDFEPISGENIEIIENTNNIYTCSVAGYPASKSKKYSGLFNSKIFAFTGMNVSKDVYDKLDLSNSINIVLRFDRKNAIDPNTGESFPAPSLRGVSGGGIFSWPPNKPYHCDWSERKLIGIFHTYKEKENIIIGSTMIPFLSAITLGQMKGFGGY